MVVASDLKDISRLTNLADALKKNKEKLDKNMKEEKVKEKEYDDTYKKIGKEEVDVWA